jgi:hypothetical protein
MGSAVSRQEEGAANGSGGLIMFAVIKKFFTDPEYFNGKMVDLYFLLVTKRPVFMRVGIALFGYALHKNWIPTYINGGGDTIGGLMAVVALAFPSTAGAMEQLKSEIKTEVKTEITAAVSSPAQSSGT